MESKKNGSPADPCHTQLLTIEAPKTKDNFQYIFVSEGALKACLVPELQRCAGRHL